MKVVPSQEGGGRRSYRGSGVVVRIVLVVGMYLSTVKVSMALVMQEILLGVAEEREVLTCSICLDSQP